jgi:pimeloyl-ACP methyl ester carboxylesterase
MSGPAGRSREFVVAGDVALAARDWCTAGQTAVLLHGLNGTLLDFEPIVPLVEGLHCVGYDLRGHGHSRSGALGIDQHVDDLLRVLDLCGADRAVLVGSSFGAVIALVAAGEHPDRVRAVVSVEGPVAEGTAAEEQRRRLADDIRASIEAGGRPWQGTSAELDTRIAEAVATGRREAGERRRYQRIGDDTWQQRPDVETAVDMIVRATPAPGAFGRIRCPVLALVGATSSLLAPTPESRREAAQRLVTEHRNFELVIVQGGHDLLYESPTEVAEAINEWTAGRRR